MWKDTKTQYKEHLPEYYQDIQEIEVLNDVLSPVIQEYKDKVNDIIVQKYIHTATDLGLSRYEFILNIPKAGDLDMRRFNILQKLTSQTPYTYLWLDHTLKQLIGVGSYEVDLNIAEYTLDIWVTDDKEKVILSLKKQLRELIPANISLGLGTLASNDFILYTGATVQSADIYNF